MQSLSGGTPVAPFMAWDEALSGKISRLSLSGYRNNEERNSDKTFYEAGADNYLTKKLKVLCRVCACQ